MCLFLFYRNKKKSKRKSARAGGGGERGIGKSWNIIVFLFLFSFLFGSVLFGRNINPNNPSKLCTIYPSNHVDRIHYTNTIGVHVILICEFLSSLLFYVCFFVVASISSLVPLLVFSFWMVVSSGMTTTQALTDTHTHTQTLLQIQYM